MGFQVQIFPIYGITTGFQYVDGRNEAFGEEPEYRSVQLFIFLFGIEVSWYVESQD